MKTTFNWSKVDKPQLLGRVFLLLLYGFCMAGCILSVDLMIRREELTVFRGSVQIVGAIMWLCLFVREIRRIVRIFRDGAQ